MTGWHITFLTIAIATAIGGWIGLLELLDEFDASLSTGDQRASEQWTMSVLAVLISVCAGLGTSYWSAF